MINKNNIGGADSDNKNNKTETIVLILKTINNTLKSET